MVDGYIPGRLDMFINGGKLFAGFFALYAGGLFLAVAGLFLAPLIHRIMHKFHWEERESR